MTISYIPSKYNLKLKFYNLISIIQYYIMIKYPASIDNDISLPQVNDSTRLAPNIFNNLRDGILSIENELGLKPSSIYGTVRGRLDYLEGLVKKSVLIGGDIGGTPNNPLVIGIQGKPVSPSNPQINDALIWNGTSWIPSPQTQLSPGNNYSDYIFWDPGTSSWRVGSNSIHLGSNAGSSSQGNNAIAIGLEAGRTGQGNYSIAIGANAVESNQANNSIAINAEGLAINATNSGLYVSPIREELVDNSYYGVYYNDSTKEVVKGNINNIPVNIVGGTSYNVINTDYFVGATGGSTVTLPSSPVSGQTHIIKDISGSAGGSGNNITINGSGGLKIDGSTSKNINIDYQSLTVVYNGTSWSSI